MEHKYKIKLKELDEVAEELTPVMFVEDEVTLMHKTGVGSYSPQMFGMFGKEFIGGDNINPDTYDVEHTVGDVTYIFKIRTWMCSSIDKI